jgi:hypothetical protein
MLTGADLAIDAFDNSAARAAVSDGCRANRLTCLRAGLANGYAEVLWEEVYRVPSASHDDVRDYPLARNLVTLTVTVACESALRALLTGAHQNWTVSLGDLSIQPFA